jgi:hypothetical protein
MGPFQVNYLAVLVCGVLIFVLGGLWYSPLLFAKKWMSLMGITEADMKAASGKSMGLQYATVFFCGLLTAWLLAVAENHVKDLSAPMGALAGAFCWLFAGITSFGTALFSMKPIQLWMINSGYNLVAFVTAGTILAVWR